MAKKPKKKKAETRSRQSEKAGGTTDDIIVGQKAAAGFLGVDQKTIQRWQKKGLPFELRARTKIYRKSDLSLFRDSEGASVSPHREREQKAKAEDRETLVEIRKIELAERQDTVIDREEVERRTIFQITMLRKGHQKMSRELMPLIEPYLREPKADGEKVKEIIDTKLRQLDQGYADGLQGR